MNHKPKIFWSKKKITVGLGLYTGDMSSLLLTSPLSLYHQFIMWWMLKQLIAFQCDITLWGTMKSKRRIHSRCCSCIKMKEVRTGWYEIILSWCGVFFFYSTYIQELWWVVMLYVYYCQDAKSMISRLVRFKTQRVTASIYIRVKHKP